MTFYEKDSNTAILKFYGYIGMWWNGANDFTDTIRQIEGKYKNLEIKTHCYGGSVLEGSVMFNAIQASKLNVDFYIDGVAASMMSIVMLAGRRVYMADNAFVMVHCPTSVTEGNAADHFSTGKLLKSMQLNFGKVYAKKTGKPQADVDAWFDGTDHWFSADECISMKLADAKVNAIDNAPASIVKPDMGTDVQSVFERYAAIAKPETTSPIQQQQSADKMDKQLMITQFGLTGVTAASTDEQVMQAMQAKVTNLENTGKAALKATVTAMISAKETQLNKKFTDDQKTQFETFATATSAESLQKLLDGYTAAPTITSMMTPENKTEGGQTSSDADKARANWTYADWEKNDPSGLEKMSFDDQPGFEKLLKTMK